MKVQLTLEKLKAIVEVAEERIERDNSLSRTVTIDLKEECDTHLGNDKVDIRLKSGYAECVGTFIGT